MGMEKINRKDFRKIKQKYFLKKILQEIKTIVKKKDILTIKEKINRTPLEFLEFFNQESYLIVNPDVRGNALEHFIFYGYEEVKNGKRRIGNAFPFMSESEYLGINPDLENIEKLGVYSSKY